MQEIESRRTTAKLPRRRREPLLEPPPLPLPIPFEAYGQPCTFNTCSYDGRTASFEHEYTASFEHEYIDIGQRSWRRNGMVSAGRL